MVLICKRCYKTKKKCCCAKIVKCKKVKCAKPSCCNRCGVSPCGCGLGYGLDDRRLGCGCVGVCSCRPGYGLDSRRLGCGCIGVCSCRPTCCAKQVPFAIAAPQFLAPQPFAIAPCGNPFITSPPVVLAPGPVCGPVCGPCQGFGAGPFRY